MDSAKDGSTGNTSMAEEKEQLGRLQRGEEEEEEEEEEEGEAEEESKKKNGMMKPWEQHSGVISIPRFDYNAPSSLLLRSHSGFLLTCPIKREKSATKEAISILQQFIGSFNSCSSECSGTSDGDVDAKRRKICMEEIDHQECPTSTQGKLLEDSSVEKALIKSDSAALSLVRLTRSGLLLFTLPSNDSPDVVDIVSKIMCSLESGSLVSPVWCHRIFPIQATCCLNEKDLRTTVSKLVLQFVNDKQDKLARPVKFAVGYNRRGIEETEMKISKNTSKGHEDFALLDRNKCFTLVATAVNDVLTDSVVDLKSPELSVLVELLPISGLPKDALVVAVSVLPCNLVTTKPRLCIRALLSDTKAKNDGRKTNGVPNGTGDEK